MVRQPRGSKYVQMEAESSDEDIDSSVDSQDMDGLQDFVEPDYTKMSRHNYVDKVAELEAKYIRPHGTNEEVKEEESDYDDVAETPCQSKLLPLPSDPALFLCRVKFGKEKQIAASIAEAAKDISDVTAVLSKDGLKGYVYVEAFKKTAVDEAVYGVRNVYKNRITPINPSEMVDVMNCNKDYNVGDYARMKSGRYRGDLVQIVENFSDCCQIRAIPRINQKRKLFDPEEHRNEIQHNNGGYYYNRDFYKDGYLIKSVLKNNLEFDVTPTFEDLKELSGENAVHLNDEVVVKKGELQNFKGKIVNVSGNTCTVSSKNQTFDVDINLLKRHVEVGDSYSYDGINGMVLKVNNDNTVILGVKEMTDEIVVSINDLEAPVAIKLTAPKRKPFVKTRQDQLVNRKVQIIAGEYKGMVGRVENVAKDTCRIQLGTTSESVTTYKNDLKVLEPIYSYASTATPGYKTPGKTPGYTTPGYKTPGYTTPGYKTPGYTTPGYKTPSYTEPQKISEGANVSEGVDVKNDADSIFMAINVFVNGTMCTVERVVDKTMYVRNTEFKLSDIKTYTNTNMDFADIEKEDDDTVEIMAVQPKNKFENVFVFRGEHAGVSGTVVEYSEDTAKVQLIGGENIRVKLEDLTTKSKK